MKNQNANKVLSTASFASRLAGGCLLSSALVVGALAGCTETPKATPKKEPVKKTTPKKEPVKKAEPKVATANKSNPDCVGPHATAPETKWEAAGRTYALNGRL